jgi:di/tricarboxylate transporter
VDGKLPPAAGVHADTDPAMTAEIALVLGILLGAIVLFVTEWIRMDLVALLVLVAVALTGLVTPAEAFTGFSNPAVVTVWAMFIISGGLTLTGVAGILGRRLIQVAGTGEVRLIVAIMATAGILSAFMNNVGVAAMMLPVVIDIARRTGHAPSRLLMPLALGSLLGGLTTLIGTPPNILVADAVRDYGLPPFGLFDFTPIGGVVLVAGITFVALVGRHLLPQRDPLQETAGSGRTPGSLFELGERLLTVRIPPDSPLAGQRLGATRLGAALRMTVVAVIRDGRTLPAPGPDTVLQGADRLLALGRPEFVEEVRRGSFLVDGSEDLPPAAAMPQAMNLVEGRVPPDSPLVGATLLQAGLRGKYGVNVLSIRRDTEARFQNLPLTRLEAGDVLLLHGSGNTPVEAESIPVLQAIRAAPPQALREFYRLHEQLMALRVPEESVLAGRTLGESRLRDALGLTVWEIRRAGGIRIMPDPDEILQPGDVLLVQGTPEDLRILSALRELEIESQEIPDLAELESAEVGLAELVLSPETTLEGRTLRELEFRDRYGLTVLAIWRQGQAHRTDLRDMEIRFGDAILVHGPRERLRLLGRDPNFVVASEPAPPPPRQERAPLAVLILVGVLAPVVIGWIPIAIAAVTGAVLMVLTRCLSMEDAYRFIEWQAVFLIAGMLPLGLAMERTGAAAYLADGMVGVAGEFGPRAVMAGIYLMTALATQVVPTAALVVLMAPIAFNAATDLGVSPLPFLMTLAMAASASFSSPVSHPANTLIMGPGGYRFVDYLRLGLPLTILVFVIVVLLVPVLWPFVP